LKLTEWRWSIGAADMTGINVSIGPMIGITLEEVYEQE
jgi:hypothetical protein